MFIVTFSLTVIIIVEHVFFRFYNRQGRYRQSNYHIWNIYLLIYLSINLSIYLSTTLSLPNHIRFLGRPFSFWCLWVVILELSNLYAGVQESKTHNPDIRRIICLFPIRADVRRRIFDVNPADILQWYLPTTGELLVSVPGEEMGKWILKQFSHKWSTHINHSKSHQALPGTTRGVQGGGVAFLSALLHLPLSRPRCCTYF